MPTFNDEEQGYTPKNVLIVPGRGMLIQARKETFRYPNDNAVYKYTSGRVDTRDSFSFEYGKFEAEMILPDGAGAWPAFWFLSANQAHTNKLHPTDKDWGQERFYLHDGEVDGVETSGKQPTLIEATLHTFDQSTEGHITVPDATKNPHVYGVEFAPDELRWTVDGTPYFSRRKPANATPDNWPFMNGNRWYPIFNLAMGGTMGGEITSQGPWTLAVSRATFYDYTGPR